MLSRLDRALGTLRIRLLGWTRIPLLASVRPCLVDLDGERCVIRVPLRRWTRNHWGSMYFGALAIGADTAGGLLAMEAIRRRGGGVSLVFKDFKAEFLRRPESDVYFICEAGATIRAQVERAAGSGERITEPVAVRAVTGYGTSEETEVAAFVLGLSLKGAGA